MKTLTVQQAQGYPKGQLRSWLYNAMDALGTREIADTVLPRLDPQQLRAYAFERAAQGPAMAMGSRGIRVDTFERDRAVKDMTKELRALERDINKVPELVAVWDLTEKVTGQCPSSTRKDGKHTWAKGEEDTPARLCTACGRSRMTIKPFNPNSSHQAKHLLYELLKLKRQYNKEGEVSADEEALQKLLIRYPKHAAILEPILAARGLAKQIGFLKTRLTPDGRFTSSFNVGAAWTFRWSASSDPYGQGGNAQNISERHRKIFQSDPGYELVYADLKQAESNIVAHLAGDEQYIEAHASGDVHTYVTRLVWPDMPWTGDLKADKKIAKTLPDWDQAPGHDFRFQSKRIQHGSNFGLTPFGIAIIAHIPVAQAAAAQRAYFKAFPGIKGWQDHIKDRVRQGLPLVSPLGIKTRLFGRPWDEHTFKQGYSVLPQGTVAHIINLAAWNIWQHLDPAELMLLAQIHDALLWQQPLGHRDTLRRAIELMTIPVPVTDYKGVTRMAMIEAEAAVGLNWGHQTEDNPEGLVEVTF